MEFSSSKTGEGVAVVDSRAKSLSFTDKTMTGLAFAMCALAAIFYCYEYYLRVAPSVMSAELKFAFNLSDAAFGHLAACYYYAYTPMQIPVGMMMDKYGLRRILTIACLTCVVGTYLFSATGSVLLAQIGRFLVGFGSAFAYVGILKISDVWLPRKYFAFMAGLSTTLGLAGAMSGQLTMAYMVKGLGWQSTLMYSVIIGGVLTAALWVVLRDEATNEKKKEAKEGIGILKGLAFMVKNKSMWINGIIGCLTYLPLSAFAELWAIPFLEAVGFSKPEAAMGSSMVLLGFAVGGPLFGLMSDKIQSRRVPLIFGSLLSALFMFLLITMPSVSKPWMFSLLFLSGFFASVEILVFAVGNDLNRKEVAATAVAFTNMFTMLGGVVLPPLIGKLLDNSHGMINGVAAASKASDFSSALLILPCALVLAGILSMVLRESYQTSK